ncbi:MAG: hypothetical protein INR64_12745 [Caulobacteraceae bacterium]|nr:hypothetical protein [Caulobacter sp.]
MKAWIWPSVAVDVGFAVPAAPSTGGGGGGGLSLVAKLVSVLVPVDAVVDCSADSSAPIRPEAEIPPLVDAAAAVPAAAVPGGAGGGASVADMPSGPVPPSDDPDRRARKAIMAEEVALPVLSIDVPEAVLAAPVVPEAAVVAPPASRSPLRSCDAIR